jgi:asparagine synthase (glutamine-hydrolysing)
MTRTLSHRGPDSEGTWVDIPAGIALGHRRLAVIDLSPAGHQPMMSASGRYVLVFNGEIYNFLDLLEEVAGEGEVALRGHSDTEIMLACFDYWGVAGSVSRFNGMFAFAVWDRLERRLHLARDRMGEKPLYYGWADETFLFGSELKALRPHPAFPDIIDRDVLALFLKYSYVPAPYSIYKGILKLPPGALLTIQAGSWREEMARYWTLREAASRGRANPFSGSDREAVDRLESLLIDATRIRMISDVPVGAFFSGGIDSTLVAALMQSLSSKPVKTFTIGFHEQAYNEAVAAKAVAEDLKTNHTEWYISPAEARAVIPRLPKLYDEPFADSSQIPTFLVSELARRHVTVSLSGDAGDEVFGGYTRYSRVPRRWRMLQSLPVPLRPLLAKALEAIVRDGVSPFLPLGPQRLDKLERLAAVTTLTDPATFYDAHQSCWANAASVVLGAGEISRLGSIRNEWSHFDHLADALMAVDAVTYLPDDILVKVDRAAMGVSLETRIPLLDPRIVEFAWTLPHRMRFHGGQKKWILRRILYKYVPRALVERPKSGFGVPIAEWIRGPLREWAEELLDPERIHRQGYLAGAVIRRKWTEHLSGKYNHGSALWCVLMFQAWLENQSQAVGVEKELDMSAATPLPA